MIDVLLHAARQPPVARQPCEYVERKGLGHPDSMCDAVMESISVALSRMYVERTGRVLHHNIDKGLLVAGRTTPRLGGGSVDEPMRLVIGDRATNLFQGTRLPVHEVAVATARQWLKEHLRFVDAEHHIVFQDELRPGSAELVDIFARPILVANDTSAAVGYAPLSETERLVLVAERHLNSPEFKQRFPETGEDVKVMGVRRGRRLHLTVATAFVDRFLSSEQNYFDRKAAAQHALREFLTPQLCDLDGIDLCLNMLDEPGRGLGGMYLTVLGTSAESGDGGQVGRGNRVNGVISLNRPMTLEAAAGKNPVSHVGKIYNVLAHQIAARICAALDAVEESYVWLCSQIGGRLDEPWFASVQLSLKPGVTTEDVAPVVRQIVDQQLADVVSFSNRLVGGEFPVC